MQAHPIESKAAGAHPRRLFAYNAGFWRAPRLRRILQLAGYDLTLGLPSKGDAVAVWGRSPYAKRGETIAAWRAANLIRVEDTFLRSIRPGRAGDAPLGLFIDPFGVHFDASQPSLLEHILATEDLNDSHLLMRASLGIVRLKALHLSKYNIHDPSLPCPTPGYVLVVDQTKGDASLKGCGADVFDQMLAAAKREHPGKRIVVKSHPETNLSLRGGHFAAYPDYTLLTTPVSPWMLLAGAAAVYTVSSQLGFEAILAGHRPRVFGTPFYAGWGASDDACSIPRRTRNLTPEQLFAAAMILAPTWYDPCRDRLCSFEEAVDQLEAEARTYREDRAGHIALGMRLWKRGRLQAVFGRHTALRFADSPEKAVALAATANAGLLVWAGAEPAGLTAPTPIRRVEDGFLRSRGLGAELIPPLSLVADDLGIYYDPSRESRLERIITSPAPPGAELRARALVERVIRDRLCKYNLSGTALPTLPVGHRILVPGQVEDDASIRLGAGQVRSNLALVKAARKANLDAILIYKPHPDVEAGLRPGLIDPKALVPLVDYIANKTDPIALLDQVQEVWTMTSLLGFEALIRGKKVTCLGTPFYAGWGLTNDLGPVPQRRLLQPDGTARSHTSLDLLVHATLISYPRYFDPVSRLPCPPEVVLDRLRNGAIPRPSLANRLLAKTQGKLASHAALWR
ncbi:capsular polysaccharide biosynthesis protein (plasmid) [Pseudorhodobacter turbinis]|uniref:Capsular polysaccharide biosynthesis protein n=1 Tax=Pseudorhodobacter turbinis TaxID=2500533 RepID=A0A4P8ELL0_9RHOB|nr:capsular polysaccharide biosynthesis protein [Pseudorhodobacter turbinis]QCO57889.1 capsular polysaccharide biosynthesis protein [Pseudorhodobacter turbinis]